MAYIGCRLIVRRVSARHRPAIRELTKVCRPVVSECARKLLNKPRYIMSVL